MSFSSVSEQTTHPSHNRLLLSALLVLTCILAWAALILPISIRPTSFPIKIGDVASQDIQAPYALSYTSAILTKRAQDEAVRQVSPVYLPADPSITRRQIELLRVDLAFINTVRFDTYATDSQKLSDLSAIPDLKLSDTTWKDLLALSDSRWQILQNESTSVLEQVMRNTIRDVDLPNARRSIPTLVSLSL